MYKPKKTIQEQKVIVQKPIRRNDIPKEVDNDLNNDLNNDKEYLFSMPKKIQQGNYLRTTWINEETKLNSTNLNNIEDGIYKASENIEELKNEVSEAQDSIAILRNKTELHTKELEAIKNNMESVGGGSVGGDNVNLEIYKAELEDIGITQTEFEALKTQNNKLETYNNTKYITPQHYYTLQQVNNNVYNSLLGNYRTKVEKIIENDLSDEVKRKLNSTSSVTDYDDTELRTAISNISERLESMQEQLTKMEEKLSTSYSSIKFYKEIEELELTAPTTTAEIFNRMKPNSIAIINCQHSEKYSHLVNGVCVSDQPISDCLLTIFKYDYFRYQITAQQSKASDLGYSAKLYYGSLIGSNIKSGVRWIKIKNQDVHGENGTDLNSKTTAGNYFVMNAKNGPIGYHHFFVEVEVFYGGGFVLSESKSVIAQTLTEYSTGLKFSRTKNGDNAWGSWKLCSKAISTTILAEECCDLKKI